MKTGQELKREDLLRVETTQFVLPEHLNHMGNMHGGEILKLMDNTVGIVCSRYSMGNAVTAAVNEFSFMKPVPAGSVIRCIAEIDHVGKTSMQVLSQLFVEKVETGESYKAAEGRFVGVAVDAQGHSRKVPEMIRAVSV